MFHLCLDACKKYYFAPRLEYVGNNKKSSSLSDQFINSDDSSTTGNALEMTNVFSTPTKKMLSRSSTPSTASNSSDDSSPTTSKSGSPTTGCVGSPLLSLHHHASTDYTTNPMTIATRSSHSVSANAITWKESLQTNRKLYDLACWTGIIYPVTTTSSTNDIETDTIDPSTTRLTENQVAWRQRWVIFLHIALYTQLLLFFLNIPFVVYTPISSSDSNSTDTTISKQLQNGLIGLSWIAAYLPVIATCGGMITLRHCIMNSTPLFKHQTTTSSSMNHQMAHMDLLVITEQCIAHTLPLIWKLIYCFSSMAIVYCIIEISFIVMYLVLDTPTSSSMVTNTSTILVLILYFCSLPGIFPSILMIFGLLSFIIIEQRISYFTMLHLRSLAMQSLLTDTDYLIAGKDMKYRDSISPMNWIIIGSGLDSALCIFMLFVFGYGNDFPNSENIEFIVFLTLIFMQQLIILLIILYEILKVNEIIDVLFLQTTKQRVVDHMKHGVTAQAVIQALMLHKLLRKGESGSLMKGAAVELFGGCSLNESPAILDTEDLIIELMQGEEKRVRRLELQLLVKEYRIGTTILFVYRPSKIELMVQMTSIVIALGSSLLKIIIKSVSH